MSEVLELPNAPEVEEKDDDATEKSLSTFVEWTNPPSVADLKADYEDAKPSHDTAVTQIQEWLDNLHAKGRAKVNAPRGNSRIVPKVIRRQAEWRYSALSEAFLSSSQVYSVKPRTWADTKAALQNQVVLNKQFNTDIDKVKFIDDYVRAAVDEGTIILMVGWEFEEEQYQADVPVVTYVVNPMYAEVHAQLDEMYQEDPSRYFTEVPDELRTAHEMYMERGEPIEPVITGYETKMLSRTVVNRPTVEVCDFRNVIIDPSCMGNIEKAQFVIRSFETSIAQLQKEPNKYKNLDQITFADNHPLSQPDHSIASSDPNFNFRDNARKIFVAYEYWGNWDINKDGVLKPIVATWVGNVLIRLELNPFPDKKPPFVVEHYLPVRRAIYGEPDGALLEDNQKVIGAVTRGMIDVMGRSANGQIGIRKDLLDVTNRRKFDKGLDYEFNPSVDPRQGILNHVYPEIPNSAQYMLQLQNMEAEAITGVKSYSQSGISGAALGDVAAGVRGVLDAASKREMGIIRRLGNGILKLGRKLIAMNAEFLDEKETVRITDEQFVQVKRDDLAGNFDMELGISSPEEDDMKAKELSFMLQTMGNNLDGDMTKMILAEIARLRKMPELAKKIQNFQPPPPDPLMQRKVAAEVALLEAQVVETQTKALANQTGAQLNAAKTGTEQVKQGNMQSATDLQNLDFVEQESGVKQARDLQKIGEQARSQVALKQVDLQIQREKNQKDLVKEYLKNKKAKK